MVVIRLARGGSHNRPFFYIVVADSRARRDGRFIEKLGFWNPSAAAGVEALRVAQERFDYWVSVGAKPSDTVRNMLKRQIKQVA